MLGKVLREGEALDRVFAEEAISTAMVELDHRDRAFIRLLVATVLRRKGQLDDIINRFLSKPLPKRSGRAREILASGAAQLLFLKTPPHAAINIAVELCRHDRRAQHLGKLVNAVLRKVATEGGEILSAQDEARLNTPDWLWQRWQETYGDDVTRSMAMAHLIPPGLDISVKSDPERWAEKLGGVVLPTGSVRLQSGGRIEELRGFETGDWWVQDVAATLPVKMLGDVSGLRVADLCAAPGGKTAALVTAGAHVSAIDQSEARLKRLRENLKRLNLEAEIYASDIFDWVPDAPFDAILLDAPCSATGTLRRHPDALHIKKPGDAKELAELQFRMIKKAAGWLKDGGRLVFCTCSLDEIEGEGHLERIAKELPELALSSVRETIQGLPEACIGLNDTLRTLPCHMDMEPPIPSGMDGFFAAKFIKKTKSEA